MPIPALLATHTPPGYVPGVPIFEQTADVEDVYFARLWAGVGLGDPGKMTTEDYIRVLATYRGAQGRVR